LSICIPTYNRCNYLTDLLNSLIIQFEKNTALSDLIKIYISDNASTDSTASLCKKYSRFHYFEYSKNETNIGAARNIYKCCQWGNGKYRWVIGDDELLEDGSLEYIIEILNKINPGLFINNDHKYNSRLKLPKQYNSFRDFAKATIKSGNPHMLLAHTLITSNIFRSDCFISAFAFLKLTDTLYAHMYGIVKGINENNASVFITEKKTIHVRDQRAETIITEEKFSNGLGMHWVDYLSWLKSELNLPKLNIKKALKCQPTFEEKVRYNIFRFTNKIKKYFK